MILLREFFRLCWTMAEEMPISDTILVTGGGGFIRANFVLSLIFEALHSWCICYSCDPTSSCLRDVFPRSAKMVASFSTLRRKS